MGGSLRVTWCCGCLGRLDQVHQWHGRASRAGRQGEGPELSLGPAGGGRIEFDQTRSIKNRARQWLTSRAFYSWTTTKVQPGHLIEHSSWVISSWPPAGFDDSSSTSGRIEDVHPALAQAATGGILIWILIWVQSSLKASTHQSRCCNIPTMDRSILTLYQSTSSNLPSSLNLNHFLPISFHLPSSQWIIYTQ